MNKKNKTTPLKEKESKPSSLWHYTSFETLTKILDPSKECIKDRKMLNFRFGNPLQTNDKKEVHFFEEFVYKGKIGNELKQQVENVKEDIGKPFILSLIHHRENPRNYLSCEIPMWRMYGNQFAGVRLKFDYQKMEKYCKSSSDISLEKCTYLTKTKMEEKGKSIRDTFMQSNVDTELKKIYKASVCYKTYDWEHENEWRLIVWSNDNNKIDFNPQNGRLFIPQEIPLDWLTAVEIGPKADYEACEGSLQLIKEKLGSISENHFKIKRSKLEIGYV